MFSTCPIQAPSGPADPVPAPVWPPDSPAALSAVDAILIPLKPRAAAGAKTSEPAQQRSAAPAATLQSPSGQPSSGLFASHPPPPLPGLASHSQASHRRSSEPALRCRRLFSFSVLRRRPSPAAAGQEDALSADAPSAPHPVPADDSSLTNGRAICRSRRGRGSGRLLASRLPVSPLTSSLPFGDVTGRRCPPVTTPG